MGTMIQSTAADYVRLYARTAPSGVTIYDGYTFVNGNGQRVEVGNPLDLMIAETKAQYGKKEFERLGFTFTAMRGGIVVRQWQIKRPGKPPVIKTQSFRYVEA